VIVVTVPALTALVAFVTAVDPIWPTMSAAEATATAAVPAPLSKAPEVKEVVPVPPLPTGSVPVVPPSIGNPVTLVITPLAGVPSAGDTSVGLLDNTLLPEPVDVVTPVPPLATGKVPVVPPSIGRPTVFAKLPDDGVPKAGVTNVGLLERTALPVPVDVVTPVPPRATESVPVVPATIGRPVALVNVADDGVPKAGVTSVGLFANTKAPEPVSSVTAASKLADDGVARNVATPAPRPEMPVDTGRPVTLVITPLAGVPKAGAVIVGLFSVGLVSVLFVSVCVPDNVATVESIATVTAEEPL